MASKPFASPSCDEDSKTYENDPAEDKETGHGDAPCSVEALYADTDIITSEETGPREPNASMRKMLAEHWHTLDEERKTTLRAARARRGIKCHICGKVGYYREFCPNECVSPPPTPDSWESTPPATPPKSPVGLGVLWGDAGNNSSLTTALGDGNKKGRYDYKKKVDMNIVRPQAQVTMKKLQDEDSGVGTYEFFSTAKEGYSRTFSELTLHQVMRRMMRLLERQLHHNATQLEASFDTTLLHPPFEKDSETFYPQELFDVKEFRDYFVAKELKKENKRNYRNQCAVRNADELDPLFRGGIVSDDFLYTVNPRAGASMHSKNTWKSVLSHSDALASSDPTMAKKQETLDHMFRSQSQWIAMQKRGMQHKNDRFEHLVFIMKSEMQKEHGREARLLKTGKHSKKAVEMELYQERLESCDVIMRCLKAYNFTSGLDEADFLIFCVEKWKQVLRDKIYAGKGSGVIKYKPNLSRAEAALKQEKAEHAAAVAAPEAHSSSAAAASSATAAHTLQDDDDGDDYDDDVESNSDSEGEDAAGGNGTDPNTAGSHVGGASSILTGKTSLPVLVHKGRRTSGITAGKKAAGKSSSASVVSTSSSTVTAGTRGGYNRMIAAESPYAQDMDFLDALKRKKIRLRKLGEKGAPVKGLMGSLPADNIISGGGGMDGGGSRSWNSKDRDDLSFVDYNSRAGDTVATRQQQQQQPVPHYVNSQHHQGPGQGHDISAAIMIAQRPRVGAAEQDETLFGDVVHVPAVDHGIPVNIEFFGHAPVEAGDNTALAAGSGVHVPDDVAATNVAAPSASEEESPRPGLLTRQVSFASTLSNSVVSRGPGWGDEEDINRSLSMSFDEEGRNVLQRNHAAAADAANTRNGMDIDDGGEDGRSWASQDADTTMSNLTNDTSQIKRAAQKGPDMAEIEAAFLEAHQHSQGLLDAKYDTERKQKHMASSKALKQFVVVPRRHQREIDEDNIRKAKRAFKAAGMKHHIRRGDDEDWAYLAPALIPIPGAFKADGSNPMVSHTAEKIMFEVKKSMILADLGYTPQSMQPLYVRSTLIEKNGTTPGGDQTYDTMSKDRRYTHYMGRPLNRFEPEVKAVVERSDEGAARIGGAGSDSDDDTFAAIGQRGSTAKSSKASSGATKVSGTKKKKNKTKSVSTKTGIATPLPMRNHSGNSGSNSNNKSHASSNTGKKSGSSLVSALPNALKTLPAARTQLGHVAFTESADGDGSVVSMASISTKASLGPLLSPLTHSAAGRKANRGHAAQLTMPPLGRQRSVNSDAVPPADPTVPATSGLFSKASNSTLKKRAIAEQQRLVEEARLRQEREDKKAIRREMKKLKEEGLPLSSSMVRMAFSQMPSLEELNYLDEK